MPFQARSERDNQFVRGHVEKTRALRAFSQLLKVEPEHFSGTRREAAYRVHSQGGRALQQHAVAESERALFIFTEHSA